MLTAENSISVELLTDCLLRFVPSGTVPNTSIAFFPGLVIGSGSPYVYRSPRNLLFTGNSHTKLVARVAQFEL